MYLRLFQNPNNAHFSQHIIFVFTILTFGYFSTLVLGSVNQVRKDSFFEDTYTNPPSPLASIITSRKHGSTVSMGSDLLPIAYLFTHRGIILKHDLPTDSPYIHLKYSPVVNPVTANIPESSLTVDVLPASMPHDCFDIFSDHLFGQLQCELPSTCLSVKREKLARTWYGSAVYACTGLHESNITNLVTIQYNFSPFWLTSIRRYLSNKRININNLENYDYKLYRFNSTMYYILPADLFTYWNKYSISKSVTISSDWSFVSYLRSDYSPYYKVITQPYVSKTYIFRNPWLYRLQTTVLYMDCVFYDEDKMPGTNTYLQIPTSNNTYMSYVCTEFVPFNLTHSICSLIFNSSIPIDNICPIYFIPFPSGNLPLKFGIRTKAYSFFDTISDIYYGSISEIISHLLKSSLKNFDNLIVHLTPVIKDVLTQATVVLGDALKGFLSTFSSFEGLAHLLETLLETVLNSFISVFLKLEERILLFEIIITFVLCNYYLQSKLSSLLLTIVLFSIIGITRNHTSLIHQTIIQLNNTGI